jgi:hypothetical protein
VAASIDAWAINARMRVSGRRRDRQGRETMGGDVDMFWVDHGPCLMAAVPLADGLDASCFLNCAHHDDPMEPVRRTHTRLRGVDAALDQVSYAPTISRVILARMHPLQKRPRARSRGMNPPR